MSNFQKTASYTGQFKDVWSGAWYADSAKICYEYGLMQGTYGKFNPRGTVSGAEALTLSCRIHEVYNLSLIHISLMKTRPAAVFTDEMPQILILHTHATESYTMPEGQEYNDDGATRTEDTDYNVVRVGDEIAEVFEEAGISVLHDRTLYDLSLIHI